MDDFSFLNIPIDNSPRTSNLLQGGLHLICLVHQAMSGLNVVHTGVPDVLFDVVLFSLPLTYLPGIVCLKESHLYIFIH